MLLYHCPSLFRVTFYNTLEDLLNDSNIIDVGLGDFNIDILNRENINLQHVHFNYTFILHNESLQKF